ncbi:hypothetical protein CU048_01710 [Beijerinckiaceae bacterium]|nr:hypothetical protein CU048_01710 [Beijerinckiaceae bacterium]
MRLLSKTFRIDAFIKLQRMLDLADHKTCENSRADGGANANGSQCSIGHDRKHLSWINVQAVE